MTLYCVEIAAGYDGVYLDSIWDTLEGATKEALRLAAGEGRDLYGDIIMVTSHPLNASHGPKVLQSYAWDANTKQVCERGPKAHL
jgi:hypothetical protein